MPFEVLDALDDFGTCLEVLPVGGQYSSAGLDSCLGDSPTCCPTCFAVHVVDCGWGNCCLSGPGFVQLVGFSGEYEYLPGKKILFQDENIQ